MKISTFRQQRIRNLVDKHCAVETCTLYTSNVWYHTGKHSTTTTATGRYRAVSVWMPPMYLVCDYYNNTTHFVLCCPFFRSLSKTLYDLVGGARWYMVLWDIPINYYRYTPSAFHEIAVIGIRTIINVLWFLYYIMCMRRVFVVIVVVVVTGC